MITKKQNTEFGIVVSIVILAIALRFNIDLYVFALIVLLVSLLFPLLFTPFAWIWFAFARLLERILSKVVLCLIFFLIVIPVGLIRRVFGKDGLHIRHARDKQSLFENQTHKYSPEELDKQF